MCVPCNGFPAPANDSFALFSPDRLDWYRILDPPFFSGIRWRYRADLADRATFNAQISPVTRSVDRISGASQSRDT